ncbi:MAG TPA: hypothetical protein ENK50_07965 [Sedimenticola sp.]|nr:hypothetical protein [Sedimenticola sp.]
MSSRTAEDLELEEPREERDVAAERVEEAQVRPLPSPRPRGGRWASLFALLALLLAGGGLFLGYQQWQRMSQELDRLAGRVGQIAAQRAAIRERMEQLNRRLEESGTALARERERFAGLGRQLEQERQAVQQAREQAQRQGVALRDALEAMSLRLGNDGTRWQAAEAEYLMQMANARLQLAGDVKAALLALQAADARLRDSGDPGWIGVRELLASEIDSLKGVKLPDLSGISARLAGLDQEVRSLQLPGKSPPPAPAPGPGEVVDRERTLDTLLQDAWEGFRSVLVIRRRGPPLAATLPPEQQRFVRQNLRLQLQAAQLALLLRDPVLYRQHLDTAAAWVREFFDPAQGETAAMLRSLEALQQVQLRPPLPDISASLNALRKRLQKQGGGGTAS